MARIPAFAMVGTTIRGRRESGAILHSTWPAGNFTSRSLSFLVPMTSEFPRGIVDYSEAEGDIFKTLPCPDGAGENGRDARVRDL